MRRCLSLLLFALALAVPATAGATTFGAETGGIFTNQFRSVWTGDQVMSSLNALYAAGGRVGRSDSDWAGAEPRPPVHAHHVYDWSHDDLVVAEMAQAHLRWQPILEFTPRWAQAHRSNRLRLKTGTIITPLPPASNADFGAYATAFMRRYGVRGSFWAANLSLPYVPVTSVEVWNEPDNTHDWGPQINLSDYAKMYEAVRTAVHRVDRHTQVVIGGLAWTHSSLPRLLKAFRRRPMDALAIHPYARTPRATVALVRESLAAMRRDHRGSTPVLINEYGWTSEADTWGSTDPRHVDPYVYQALVGLAQLHVAEILPFEWADASWGLNTGTFARAIGRVAHTR